MTVEMTEPQSPATAKEIKALEVKLGAALPEDYREFVMRHNGGWSHEYRITHQDPDGSQQAISIYCWFPVGRTKKKTGILGVEEVLANMSGDLPPRAVPIARDDNGDPLLLMLDKVGYGSVHFFDSRASTGVSINKLAASFTEFLGALTLKRRRS